MYERAGKQDPARSIKSVQAPTAWTHVKLLNSRLEGEVEGVSLTLWSEVKNSSIKVARVGCCLLA